MPSTSCPFHLAQMGMSLTAQGSSVTTASTWPGRRAERANISEPADEGGDGVTTAGGEESRQGIVRQVGNLSDAVDEEFEGFGLFEGGGEFGGGGARVGRGEFHSGLTGDGAEESEVVIEEDLLEDGHLAYRISRITYGSFQAQMRNTRYGIR